MNKHFVFQQVHIVCTFLKAIFMDLKMFVKGQLVDSRPINISGLDFPGCIIALRMELEEEHEEIIDLSSEEPQFFIDHIPPSMNKNRFFHE